MRNLISCDTCINNWRQKCKLSPRSNCLVDLFGLNNTVKENIKWCTHSLYFSLCADIWVEDKVIDLLKDFLSSYCMYWYLFLREIMNSYIERLWWRRSGFVKFVPTYLLILIWQDLLFASGRCKTWRINLQFSLLT